MAAVLFYSNDFYSGDWETATKKEKREYILTVTKKTTITKRLTVAFENPLQ